VIVITASIYSIIMATKVKVMSDGTFEVKDDAQL